MTDQIHPYYIQRKAGDPWTVEDFHDLQTMIKDDIHKSITTAIDGIEEVDKAGDAGKFGGKTPEQYAQEIVDRVMAELPKRTGYQMVFKVVKVGEESVVEHKLAAFPLVDVYQLEYFRVIVSEDEHIYEGFTTFYLYHSSESKIHFRPEETPTAKAISLEVDPTDGHVYRIPFSRMLELYKVDYDDDSSLDDVETDFWKAFFSDPNDEFDDDQYCHSPWMERCCREERTVKYLKGRKEWDDIWFQVRPRKTINYNNVPEGEEDGMGKTWAPNNLQVVHFDLNTLGLRLLNPPDLPSFQTTPESKGTGFPAPDPIKSDVLKVMLLLKV